MSNQQSFIAYSPGLFILPRVFGGARFHRGENIVDDKDVARFIVSHPGTLSFNPCDAVRCGFVSLAEVQAHGYNIDPDLLPPEEIDPETGKPKVDPKSAPPKPEPPPTVRSIKQDYEVLKMDELRAICDKRGLAFSIRWNKTTVIEKLEEHDALVKRERLENATKAPTRQVVKPQGIAKD